MDRTNAELAWRLLFTDIETDEETRPIDGQPLISTDSGLELFTIRKKGNTGWRYTIKIEQVEYD
jgi:hypothetical protein